MLKWDENEVQLYHPIEEEVSNFQVTGRQYYLQPEFQKGKKCLCFWGINKMMNSKRANQEQLKNAMKTFSIHSNATKVKFTIACPEDMNNLREYALHSQSVFQRERDKMNQIVIEADIVWANVINRNGFL